MINITLFAGAISIVANRFDIAKVLPARRTATLSISHEALELCGEWGKG